MSIDYKHKYIKYKTEYLKRKRKHNYECEYDLIGIGDFTHGSLNVWEYRFNILKKAINETKKNIMVFIEDSIWRSENIMKHKKIKLEKPIMWDNKYPAGPLWKYVNHATESKIYLEIIKYIRKHRNRITIIGTDNDTLARDYDIYKIIMKHLNKSNINFFWAANAHVDDRPLSIENRKWIKDTNPDLKYFCGHYLKKELGHKYCIILSQAYQGTIRYNSVCIGNDCTNRIWTLEYFYKNFTYESNKKYKTKKEYELYEKFGNKLIEFSNSFWLEKSDGHDGGYIVNLIKPKYDYILFFNTVDKLEPY